MNQEQPEREPTQADAAKELLSELKLEAGDVESGKEDLLTAVDSMSWYMNFLRSESFQEMVDAGMLSAKIEKEEDGKGNEVLKYVEIRDKDGQLLLMQDFRAIAKADEAYQVFTLTRDDSPKHYQMN